MKQFNKRMTANEEVVQESISEIRKRIITLQYEVEFSKRVLGTIEGKDLESASEMKKGIEAVERQIEALIVKLNFYKEKRTDLQAKKAMKSLKKYPETISKSDLIKIEK